MRTVEREQEVGEDELSVCVFGVFFSPLFPLFFFLSLETFVLVVQRRFFSRLRSCCVCMYLSTYPHAIALPIYAIFPIVHDDSFRFAPALCTYPIHLFSLS